MLLFTKGHRTNIHTIRQAVNRSDILSLEERIFKKYNYFLESV